VSDNKNAGKPLGKTAYYDPQSLAVTIYTDGRHTKDVLRSLAHELVHHTQNENGMLNDSGYHGQGYAQKNKNLRQSEKEAYLKGNMCFRDWEDQLKQDKPTIYNERRINNMSTKEWKNKELMENLSDKFGFKMNLKALNESKEITHMCALHVTHKASGKQGHPVSHTLTEGGEISHYTVEFDDVIVENIAVENLKILVQEKHSHKRDDKKDHDEKKPVVKEEDLEMTTVDGKKVPKFAADGKGANDLKKGNKKEEDDDKEDSEKEEKSDEDLSKVPPQLRKHVAKKKQNESRIMKIIKQEIRKQLKEVKKKDKPIHSAMISRMKDPKKVKELMDKYNEIIDKKERKHKGEFKHDVAADYKKAVDALSSQLRSLKGKK
jgi:hypothetical protein